MKKALLLSTMSALLCIAVSQAQNVFDPADGQVRWNSSSTLGTATNPNPNIEGLQKWVSVSTAGVSTGSGSFTNSAYKAYFINVGGANGSKMCFRLKFPTSYTNPDSASKKYPLMVFFHGAGEPGCPSNGGIYNNEKQLLHGGKAFLDRVNSGQFDGFLLYPQLLAGSNCASDWGTAPYTPWYDLIIRVIDSLAKYARADIDRVISTGLSNGGAATWSFAIAYPTRVAKVAPSAAGNGNQNWPNFIHIPTWVATGDKDTNPNIGYATSSYNIVKNNGGDIIWTRFPNLGHSVWNEHWGQPGFTPWMNDLHKANPLVFFQRSDFCPDSVINTKIGITPGFAAYEWQKDNNLIAKRENNVNTVVDGSSIISYEGNNITVKSYGVYKVRFKRTANGPWSEWSPKPAVIAPKPVTQTPNATVVGLKSIVLPAPDASTTVTLQQPEGYYGYQWYNAANNQQIGTDRTIDVGPGSYYARVVEQFGCGTNPSPNFIVIPASGSPKPDPAKNLTAVATSLTSIQLDWSENPNAGQNETNYEIYRSLTQSGPYTLLFKTAPDVLSYLDQNLKSNTTYYYIVRAVSAFGAAANSNEASVATELDNIPPTAPSAFTVQSTATNYAYLKWNASSDNVGVTRYEIFLNGVKTFTTTKTTFTVSNLDSNVTYTFYVKAYDAAGNVSAPSNQVTASTSFTANGLNYKYYEATGWSTLPNFNSLTPVKTGFVSTSPVLDMTLVRNSGRTDNYGILYEGYIKVPTSATYTFKLTANDGANLYVGSPYGTPEIINNDGSRNSAASKEGSIYLAAGVHPIAIAYFHNTGSGETVALTWRNNAGLSEQTVPLSAYFRSYAVSGTAPNAPSNLQANGIAHNKMQLTWNDNSNNESGFELVRSASLNGTYVPVATVAGTSYVDSNLTANTIYYYKVRAVGTGGESAFTSNFTEANWKLNGDGSNASGGTTRTLAFNGTTTYNTTEKKEGTSSLNFNGSNNYATVNNSASGSFPSDGGYSTRTVAMWIRPTSLSNSKVIFDFGNATNGIAARFNGTAIQYAVASNSTRAIGSLSNYASNPNWLGVNNWNHIAVVYGNGSVRLFLNGVDVSNVATSFTSVAASASNAARIGYSGGSNGDVAYNVLGGSGDYFVGQMDNIFVVNSAMVANEIVALRDNTYNPSWDTTKLAPSAPAAPNGLATELLPGNNVKLTWNDQSSDETGFELWRSLGNTNNFRLVANVAGGAGATKTYTDSSLFANVTYYYRVRAKGEVASSAYSNNASATTVNSVPVLENTMDFTMTYGTTYKLRLKATDTDGDPLVFTADPMPYFGQIVNLSNGVADFVFTPSMFDQGAYTIRVIVSDGFNGFDTCAFTMLVNANSLPEISPINNVTMNEGALPVNLHLVANDAEGNDNLQWYSNNLPSFATLVDSGNGRGSLKLAPSYNASGTYTITVISDDSYGAWSSKDIVVTVNEKDPNDKIQINMVNYNGFVTLWNDVDVKTNLFNVGSLRNIKNQVTTVGIQRMNTNLNNRNGGDGYITGNNTGLFPDNVMRDYLGWGGADGDDTLRLRVYGLDVSRKYNFVFFASNTCPWCQFSPTSTTTYKIGNESAQIQFWNNQNQTDTIYQIQPSPTGEVVITMIGDPATNLGGYLNALVVEAAFDDGTTPAKPLDITAEDIANTGVKLTWTDKSYNEQTYKVYRATVKAGPYSLLNPNANNVDSTQYTDLTTLPYANYYYYVVGANKYGNGTTSDTIHIATANNKPVIAGLEDIFSKTDAVVNEDFTVTDNAGDVVTVTVVNKPGFINLLHMGGNNYRLAASPTADNIGFTSLTIRAEDDKGGVSTQSINIGVADKNTRSYFINFGMTQIPAPAPWTNMTGWGNPGMDRQNLRDENNVQSDIDITIVDGWGDVNRNGHRTGNNTGIFPDSVLASGIVDAGATSKNIRLSGLDVTKRYNVVIVGSINEGTDVTNRWVATGANTVSDTIQCRYNTNLSANLNGITPNASGEIMLTVNKLSGAQYILLNGIQIEEFSSSLPPMGPTNLYVEPTSRTSVALSWSDRLNNENSGDGYELQRSTDSLFSSVTTTSLPGNTTTRTVTGLTPNTKYWFRVRAKVGSTFTDFSNRVKTITPQSQVFFNLNFSTPDAAFPWNNASESPSLPIDFNNLKNTAGQPSGITISIVTPFNGENVGGVVTGNNSGIVPDAVLQSCYWLDNTQISTMKVSGLNQNKRYRFGFIGSMGDVVWFYGNYTATYTINGRSAYLNSWLNRTKIAYIGDVQPDANGEVTIDFSTTSEGNWGFNSGLIVEAYDDVNGGAVPNMVLPGSGAGEQVNTLVPENLQEPVASNPQQLEKLTIRAYPNPFNDFISLDFHNAAASDDVRVDMYDLSGRLVYRRAYGKLPAGLNTLRINTNEGTLGSGVYMLTLVVNGKPVSAAKMLRTEKK